MNNHIRSFVLFLRAACVTAALLAPAAHARLDVMEGAAEVDALTLKASARQTVYAARCDSCPPLTLSINAQTQFFAGGRRVALSAVAQRELGATVFFDPGTYKVTRVLFWQ